VTLAFKWLWSWTAFTSRSAGLSPSWVVPVVFSLVLHALLVVGFMIVMPDGEVRTVTPAPAFVSARVVSLPAPARPHRQQPDPVPSKTPAQVRPRPPAASPAPTDPKREEARKPSPPEKKEPPARPPQPKKVEPAPPPRPAPPPEPASSPARAQPSPAARVGDTGSSSADLEAVATYEALVAELVAAHWNRPASSTRGLQVLLGIGLLPTGELVQVQKLSSSGNEAFDVSAIRAVEAAAPFHELQGMPASLFEQYFRRFRFLFTPEDLAE